MVNKYFRTFLAAAAIMCAAGGLAPCHAQAVNSEDLLESGNNDFRESAISAICEDKDKAESTAALVKALKNSYWPVRYKALLCLGDRAQSDTEAGKALVLFLRMDDGSREKVTAAAIDAIGKARPTGISFELSRYMKSPSDMVRKSAAKAMIALEDPTALKILTKSITETHCDPGPDSKPFTGAKYLEDQLKSPLKEAKLAALWAFANSKQGGQETVLVLLRDPDSEVRTEAVLALRDMGSCDAITPLSELAVSDLSPRVRIAAMWTIAAIKNDKTPRRDSDPYLRDTAEQTVKFLKEKAAVVALTNITSPEPEVRTAVGGVILYLKSDKFEESVARIVLARKDQGFPYAMKVEAAYQLWDFGGQIAADTFSKALGSFHPEIRNPARAAAAETMGGSKFYMPFVISGVILLLMLALLFLLRMRVRSREEKERQSMKKAAEQAARAGDQW